MIHNHLHLSIGHIKKETFEALQYASARVKERPMTLHAYEWPDFTIASFDIGVFLSVPIKESEYYDKLPVDLREVFNVANMVGIKLVLLDSIGSVWPNLHLPLYEW